MEMNTRLQVEHPVTELITGLDLVAEQLRIAAGEPLGITQDDVRLNGHAIEVRVYAEDPRAGTADGRAHRTRRASRRRRHPGRFRLEDGLDVSTDYDPMLAKLIAWAPTRDEARRRLVTAIDDTAIFGFETNLAFLKLLLERPEVAAGDLDTGLIARVFDDLDFPEASERTFAEAALVLHEFAARLGGGRQRGRLGGGRLTGGRAVGTRRRLAAGAGRTRRVRPHERRSARPRARVERSAPGRRGRCRAA
ncbi:MAG: hypothetical protein R2692_00140 [Microbacterium sp.]